MESERAMIRADLVRVARLEGRPGGVGPWEETYRKHGNFSVYRVRKLAGYLPWAQAMPRYGLTSINKARSPGMGAVIRDVLRVATLVAAGRRLPSVEEYEEHGQYPWHRVRKAVDGGAEELADLMGLKPSRRYRMTREQALAHLSRVAISKGCRKGGNGPKRDDVLKAAPLSDRTIKRLFGSYNGMIEAAGFLPRNPKGGWKYHAPAEKKAA